MRRFRLLLVPAVLLVGLIPASVSAAPVEADKEVTLSKGQTATWESEIGLGTNVNWHGDTVSSAPQELPQSVPPLPSDVPEAIRDQWPQTIPEEVRSLWPASDDYYPPGTCTKDPHTYCETIVLTFLNPFDPELDFPEGGPATRNRTAHFRIHDFAPNPASDYDLAAFLMTEDGERGDQLQKSGNFYGLTGDDESFSSPLRFAKDTESVKVVVDVIFYAVTPGQYTATMRF